MDVLVIDVGGSHVKLRVSGDAETRQFDSGPDLRPQDLVRQVKATAANWQYEAVSLGYPGAVSANGPRQEPGNLGDGWVGFDFESALGHPVKVVNDAAMQAIGAYDGGRMLFLGLGTGLGSALISERVVVPLELGCLAVLTGNEPGATLMDLVGKKALERDGQAVWARHVCAAAAMLMEAMAAEYIVLGGGHAHRVEPLPANVRRGGNEDAFRGGFRLWEEPLFLPNQARSGHWRVVC